MQLFSRNKALVALSLSALTVLGACGDDVTVTQTTTPETVTLSPANLSLNVGEVGSLAAQIVGGTNSTLASCTASSAVITVAVNSGACRVTAVAPGNATVTATTSSGKSASAGVTVNAPAPAIVGLSVTPAAANLTVGGTATITANPTTQATGATITRSFVTSNAAVATVNATTGVVTAVAPGTATITVTLTGSGTGLTTATVTGQVAITVTALPAGITALSVNPASVSVLPAGTATLVPAATTASGVTASFSYVSANPGVATVSSTGVVTGVAPGATSITVTATSLATSSFSASTLTATVPVTVVQRAQIAIGNITTGQTNNPVDISNVNGQIQVALNLDVGGQVVTATNVCVLAPSSTTPCTAANAAARQTYGAGGASTGTINAFINTADFTVTADSGTATALYQNGQSIIVASYEAAGSGSTASNNQVVLNFNNTDGFAAWHRAPSNSAVRLADNLTFFGGPGTAGRGSVIVTPVIYTPGRSISRATVQLAGAPCGAQSYTFVTGTDNRPWRITYGSGTTATTFFGCSSATNTGVTDLDLLPLVTASVDNQQNPGPTVGAVTAFRTATTNLNGSPVTIPGRIRADYQGPSLTVTAPLNQWASIASNYSFRSNTSMNDGVGVGFASATTATNQGTLTFTFTGCGTTAAAFDGTTGTGAIPECSTNFTQSVYTVAATGADRLGNSTTSANSGTFAIDNTPPQLRYTASSDSLTIYNGVLPLAGSAADTMFSAEALDDRSGFDAGAASHYLARANQTNSTGTCVVGSIPTAGIGSSFITNPNCTMATAAFTGAVLPDGFRPIAPVVLSGLGGTQGYYTYSVTIKDRAGNTGVFPTGTGVIRQALVNNTAPAITGLGLPGTVTASTQGAFTPNFIETVEAWFTNFRVSYAGLQNPAASAEASIIFPATPVESASAAVITGQFGRWNNVIFPNGNVTVGTPFTSGTTFYTNIEFTNANGTLSNTPTVLRPDSIGARVANVGGLVSTAGATGQYAVALLSGNVADDATRWNAKTAGANIIAFTMGTDAAQWNAPANGVKAVVTANSNQINSPFGRVDFYAYTAAGSGNWRYLGSVNGQSAPSTSAAGAGPVYIADNGGTRTWTYRLTTAACDSVTVGCTGATLGAQVGNNIIAVATTVDGQGRALATTAGAGSAILASAPSSWAAAPTFGFAANYNVAAAGVSGPTAITSGPTYTAANAFGSPANAVYSCVSANTAIATCSINSSTGAVTTTMAAGLASGATTTITVYAVSAPSNGFAGASASTSFTVTVP
ncbi:MAG: Ig-like domain-containing protein [Gemmatimonadaceae bacterium]|nr:Ig-like domain-containing protein [Gemmatimonadaceae bacterium]